MPPAIRYAAVLVAPLLLSKLVEAILASRWGRPVVVSSLGPAAAESGRGVAVYSHYTKLLTGLIVVALNRWQDVSGDESLADRLARVDGLGWLRYVSEVLLGVGALFRTASEFLEEASRLRSERAG